MHFPITTSNALAQRYFDQGLGFAYGFNHAAAIAAFREAQRLDPECALCFWGEAFAQGPNINAPMDPAVNARSVGLARYADWLARKGTAEERALTSAMVKRYSSEAGADRAALDASYADAMLAAASAFPAKATLLVTAGGYGPVTIALGAPPTSNVASSWWLPASSIATRPAPRSATKP